MSAEPTTHPGEGTDVPAADSGIDIHTTAGKLEDLHRRLDEAVHAASAKAVEKQHAKGRRTARSWSSTRSRGTGRRRSDRRPADRTATAW